MAECAHLARTSAYFDGALPGGEEAEALAHLATCAECQAFLRDAATFDAVLSQAPGRAAALPRRRRWPIAIGAVGIAAAAAVALWIALPRPPEPPGTSEVAIVLPSERAIEARFTGGRFGAYRPYDPLRGDRARESIALGALAELERRGDLPDLIAALAATGDLARARELAAKRPDDAAAEADRAALALAAGAGEDALDHAYRAIDRAPELAAGWWNLALAARAQGFPRVSRAAFARVVDRAEPGWSDEARRQIAPIDREIAQQDAEFAAYDQRGRAMIDGGAPITVDDARRFPAWARIHVLDAVCLRGGSTAAPLSLVAEAIDRQTGRQTGTPSMAAAVARAEAADPALRAKFAGGSRAVMAHTASPAEIDDLLARLRTAGHGVDDIRAGVILRSGREAALIDELRAIVAPWHDPWFDLAVARAQIHATWPRDDARAEAALTSAFAQCTGDAWAPRAGQLAGDLAERLRASGRDDDAARWALTAVARFRAAGWPVHLPAAGTPIDGGHNELLRGGAARAALDEIVRELGDTSW
jgi:Putative zinc-finger